MICINKPKFKIGQMVYHNVPEGEKVVIIDMLYRFSIKQWVCEISIGLGEYTTCLEWELSENKVYK